jgi:hypothetical protein
MDGQLTPQRMIIPVAPAANNDLSPEREWDLTVDFGIDNISKTLIDDMRLYKQVCPCVAFHLTAFVGQVFHRQDL